MSYTPWEDVSLQDSLVRRRMRINASESKPKIEFETYQDCEEILRDNQALFNRDNFSGSLWAGRGYVKVASIPMAMIEKWAKEDGINFLRFNDEDKAKLLKRLNDKDYSKLRTAPGRL